MTSEIIRFIEENCNRDIALSDIFDHFSISQGHISRILKQDMGINLREYLDKLRPEEAKKLLRTSTLTINIISEKVGYNNARSFIRMFKNHTNISPKEYKEKMDDEEY